MLKVRHVEKEDCSRRDAWVAGHWHHECWNCGSDQCGSARETRWGTAWCDSYLCACGCGESAALVIPGEAGFDPEFAASASSPA